MGSEQDVLTAEQAIVQAAAFAAKAGPVAIPIIQFVAGFIPGAAPIVQIVATALPYLTQVAQYAPAVTAAIQTGKPIFDAFDTAEPQLLDAFKQLFSLSSGVSDPTDAQVFTFAGPIVLGRAWTDSEYQNWWDRAQGGTQGASA